MSNICICGEKQINDFPKQLYSFTKKGSYKKSREKNVFGRCASCGVIRNIKAISGNEYSDYYKKYVPTNSEYTKNTYKSDYDLAAKRCDEYSVLKNKDEEKILDVGSGSGAFVDKCRQLGHETYGCEIADYSYSKNDDYIYKQKFEDIHFPVDYFHLVTCHDVLEHVINPEAFIKELFRVTKQDGSCIIDIPDFSEGDHHWKMEHIWYFTITQLEALLTKHGFKIDKIVKPIKSKVVFYLTKPKQERVQILFPPGIGDSYWSIVKIQSFLKSKGLSIADIHVVCNRELQFEAHKRSFPFIEMFPFLNATGNTFENRGSSERKKIWDEAYINKNRNGRTIFENVNDCDYFIAYNGHLRYGEELEKIDDLECNWSPPMFVSLEQQRYEKECVKKYGEYILFYFVFHGTYQHWTNQFSVEKVIESIKRIVKKTGCIPVFTGAKWDSMEDNLRRVVKGVPNCVNLCGETSVEQLFGLIKGSQMVVGYPSGLTIVSAMLEKKTLIIWNDYYNKDFAWLACPPPTRNKTYFIEFTNGLTPQRLTEDVINIISEKGIDMENIDNGTTKDGGLKPISTDTPMPKTKPPLVEVKSKMTFRRKIDKLGDNFLSLNRKNVKGIVTWQIVFLQRGKTIETPFMEDQLAVLDYALREMEDQL